MTNHSGEQGSLRRSLTLLPLCIYGVGDILGAGIYALIGKTAGIVGPACWLSFIVALVVAGLTAFSYAELGSRYPRSAGASIFCLRAFGNPMLAYIVGFLVLLSGVGSVATVSHGFAGYLHGLYPNLPVPAILISFFLVLTFVNFWGINASSFTNIFCTIIEVAGLIIVITAGMKFFGKVDYFEIAPAEGVKIHEALLQGGVLAFYAFIGFEDIVNVAEETKDPEKNLPRAILIAIGLAAVLYILTAIAAVSAVPVAELRASASPLMAVVQKGFPGFPIPLFTVIALFAVTNSGLVNFIMSSRILFGMSEEKLVPGIFGKVHPKTGTPHIAILAVLAIAATLSLTGKIVILAQSTSFLLLMVFLVMNLSLLTVKIRFKDQPAYFKAPIVIPVLGALCCAVLMMYVSPKAVAIVGALALTGLVLYGIQSIVRKVKPQQ